jgi:hypothetical protein
VYELLPRGVVLRGRDTARLLEHALVGDPLRSQLVDDGKLSGERLYASDALLEFMFGPVLDEAEPR